MGFGKGGDETVTTETELPDWLEDPLKDVTRWARRGFRQPLEYYPGSVVPEFSEDTMAGMAGIRGMADEGLSDLYQAGYDELLDTATGGGFESPYYDAMQDYAVRNALPGIYSNAELTGATGSGLAAAAASDAAMRAMAPIYQSERANQLEAVGAIPGFEAARTDLMYDPYERLMQLGALTEGREAAGLEEDAERFMFEQSEEMDRILALMGGYSGLLGSGGTTETVGPEPQRDFLSTALGTALTVAPFFL